MQDACLSARIPHASVFQFHTALTAGAVLWRRRDGDTETGGVSTAFARLVAPLALLVAAVALTMEALGVGEKMVVFSVLGDVLFCAAMLLLVMAPGEEPQA
jgi:hypothetical protein